MSWLDAAVPVRMKRVALVAADESLRDMLVRVADAAAVEIGPARGDLVTSGAAGDQAATGGEAGRRHPSRPSVPRRQSRSAVVAPIVPSGARCGDFRLWSGQATG
jgi:hypothetical protein